MQILIPSIWSGIQDSLYFLPSFLSPNFLALSSSTLCTCHPPNIQTFPSSFPPCPYCPCYSPFLNVFSIATYQLLLNLHCPAKMAPLPGNVICCCPQLHLSEPASPHSPDPSLGSCRDLFQLWTMGSTLNLVQHLAHCRSSKCSERENLKKHDARSIFSGSD